MYDGMSRGDEIYGSSSLFDFIFFGFVAVFFIVLGIFKIQHWLKGDNNDESQFKEEIKNKTISKPKRKNPDPYDKLTREELIELIIQEMKKPPQLNGSHEEYRKAKISHENFLNNLDTAYAQFEKKDIKLLKIILKATKLANNVNTSMPTNFLK